jgi:hypothetical protein
LVWLVGSALTSPPGQAQQSASTPMMVEGLRIADRYRVAAIAARRFTHADFWRAVAPSLRSSRLRWEEVGRSLQGRPLRAVHFGTGAVTVLLWSQMHGDESTATMALADLLAWLAAPDPDSVRDRIASVLTVVMVPMLNPDGAERFQRENAAGIDVNRDARRLATPEGRALHTLHTRLRPEFGFNLHDQNARTRAGPAGLQVAVALLAPAADPERSWGPTRSRARQVAAGIARDLRSEIGGRIARYDDTFNPRAFGDLLQSWGTSTVLIESGALPGDPEKQQLRRLTAAALVSALHTIARGDYASADVSEYDRLPVNAGGAYDLLVLGGELVLPGQAPLRADVAINYDEPVRRTGGRVREVGDLNGAVALDTLYATGAYLHPRAAALVRGGTAVWLPIGARALFDLREGPQPTSRLRRRIDR